MAGVFLPENHCIDTVELTQNTPELLFRLFRPIHLDRVSSLEAQDDKSTFLLENPDYSGIKRGKLRVATAPATGGGSNMVPEFTKFRPIRDPNYVQGSATRSQATKEPLHISRDKAPNPSLIVIRSKTLPLPLPSPPNKGSRMSNREDNGC